MSKCKECGNENLMVSVTIMLHLPYKSGEHVISKRRIARSDCELSGSDVHSRIIWCPECGWNNQHIYAPADEQLLNDQQKIIDQLKQDLASSKKALEDLAETNYNLANALERRNIPIPIKKENFNGD